MVNAQITSEIQRRMLAAIPDIPTPAKNNKAFHLSHQTKKVFANIVDALRAHLDLVFMVLSQKDQAGAVMKEQHSPMGGSIKMVETAMFLMQMSCVEEKLPSLLDRTRAHRQTLSSHKTSAEQRELTRPRELKAQLEFINQIKSLLAITDEKLLQ
ncbi:hypothetical protein CC86DRAFT_407307 [Ophiobolus disseminans]|uniref:Uncharacterized protein n=1 Tax=Ophiobolus disseminans TaxID=1469910 RepID=A0A6A6ZWZ1_9PLEO|nr:hypothetical protein CC86DRAFT_407307 [Ophiobolus disseminans]